MEFTIQAFRANFGQQRFIANQLFAGTTEKAARGSALMWGSLAVGLLARPWARRMAAYALVALTLTLFIVNLRRTAERAGHAAERFEQLERTHAIQRQMLDAVSRRSRDRDDLVERLREGGF